MIQYGDLGPGAQCPTGSSLEPVTTKVRETETGCLQHHIASFEKPSVRRLHCLAGWRALHHHLSCQSIAHMTGTSGGNDNSPGGALTRSLLVTVSVGVATQNTPSLSQQNVAHACLFATPARSPTLWDQVPHGQSLPSGLWMVLRSRWLRASQEHSPEAHQGVGGGWVTQPQTRRDKAALDVW